MSSRKRTSGSYKTYLGDLQQNVPRETKRRRRRLLDLDSAAPVAASITITNLTSGVDNAQPGIVNDPVVTDPQASASYLLQSESASVRNIVLFLLVTHKKFICHLD